MKTHASLGAAMADVLGLPPEVDRGAMFGAAVGQRRNPRFAREAKLWLGGKECAYCERPAEEAHHIFPYWLFPSLEMDPRFWLPVCRTGEDHHLHAAHLGNFERFDVLAVPHAAVFKFARRLSGLFVDLVHWSEGSPRSQRDLKRMLAQTGIAEISLPSPPTPLHRGSFRAREARPVPARGARGGQFLSFDMPHE